MKAYRGIGMNGGIARSYERTARREMAEFAALAGRIAASVPAGAAVLEVAPGPGFLSIELARRGLSVRAVDTSKTFVDIARRNAASAGVAAHFVHGDAAALPVAEGSVNLVVCRAAFKNFSQPVRALKEMRRVLRSGGTALLIDLRRDASIAGIKRYVDGLGVGFLNRGFMMLVFRSVLIKRAYLPDDIRRMTRDAGWAEPRIEVNAIGFEAWMTK